MARRDASPDFIEALARGLDVIRAFSPDQPVMSLAAVAGSAGLARPTARRILITLQQLGYVRAAGGGFELTPRVLELGMTYVLSRNLWEVARPHMERLVQQTRESSSIAQLDGSDMVYVARVAVPKIIALAVTIGTRFPAMQTSLGKVLLAALPPDQAERVLAEPSRSGIIARWQPDAAERAAELREVRARGWSLTDEQLAAGIRSVAAPLREAQRANVILNCHEAERSTWLTFTDAEREALATHDYVGLFELGAHSFLTLTLFIAMFERDYPEPLAFQREYAARLGHWSLPYPDIST